MLGKRGEAGNESEPCSSSDVPAQLDKLFSDKKVA
jgi:hypothetical protein